MKIFQLSLTVLICLSGLVSAQLFTMDFDEPYISDQWGYGAGVPYVQGEYSLSSSILGTGIRFNPFDQLVDVPNNGTIHFGFPGGCDAYLSRIDGQPFTVISLDVAEYSMCFNSPIPVVGIKQDGTQSSALLEIDGEFDGFGGIDDFQHYFLNWTDIVRLEFHQFGFSLDNIVVVPDPCTFLFVLGGSLAMACRGSRRR